jgi:gamma-glutamyltranspeptidase/glutathione hydrolase
MVATSQPLAAQEGLSVLRDGGTAADAAVAAAAVLSVVEPVSTGPGGDCFALVFDAKSRRISALNGSGRAPAAASADELRALGLARMPLFPGPAVTVPGAVAAWCDLLDAHGRLGLARVLAPAIRAAKEGFAATEWIAAAWEGQTAKLLRSPGFGGEDPFPAPLQESGRELLPGGRAPRAGELVRLPELARTLAAVAAGGRDTFYLGEFPRRAAAHVRRYGGWLAPEDFAAHRSTWEQPLSIDYRGTTLNECPPNGQGLAALIAAGLAAGFDLRAAAEDERQHLLVECMRLAFADAFTFVADPAFAPAPLDRLLCAEYLGARRRAVDPERAAREVGPGLVAAGSDTVYVAVVDGEGNAVSLIQSLFMGTGTGLVVPGTGVSLQNRGAGFSLRPGHPNELAPGKRPYHTIIPALLTRDGGLAACFGVMGGTMQPQGHLQVLSGFLDRDLGPQEALDAPRFQIPGGWTAEPGGALLVEDGFAPEVLEGLVRRGHRLEVVSGRDRGRMGGGQVILRDPATGVLSGGSDPRKDGCAAGF